MNVQIQRLLQTIGFGDFSILSIEPKTKEKICEKCNATSYSHFVIFDCSHSCCSNCADNLADLYEGTDAIFFCPFCDKKVENIHYE